MLINIGNFIIIQRFRHLIFVEFNGFSFSFYFLSGILKNNDFSPILPPTYGIHNALNTTPVMFFSSSTTTMMAIGCKDISYCI